MCHKCIDRDLESKNKSYDFLKKAFFWIHQNSENTIQNIFTSKKLFQKIARLVFSTLDHALYICSTCCNYFSCSLDPGKSIVNNYSITQPIKTILTQEKHIFSVLSKSNVDEAQIQNWQFAYFSIFTRNFFFRWA